MSDTLAAPEAEEPSIAEKWPLPRDTIWNGGLYKIKDKAAADAPGRKLMLVGGSSTHFGFNAERVGEALGMYAVNYGVHAAFNMEYLLHRAGAHLKPGDIFVISPEWVVFQARDYFSETLSRQIGFNDLEYALTLNLEQTRKVIGSMLENRLAEVRAKNGRAWTGPLYRPETVTRFGDETANLPEYCSDQSRDLIMEMAQKNLAVSPAPISSSPAFELLVQFAKRAHSIGATVITGFPPMLNHPVWHQGGESRYSVFMDAVDAYHRAGIRPAGRQTHYLLSLDEVLDNLYHANQIGTARMTDALIGNLREVLGQR